MGTTTRKRCPRCRKRLPATTEHFYRDRTKGSGLCSYCKPCDRAKKEAWRKTHPAQHDLHNRRWAERHPERARQINREACKRYEARRREMRRRYLEMHPEAARRLRTKTPEQLALSRRVRHLHAFGLTLGEYEAMVRYQQNVCAICGNRETHLTKHGQPIVLSLDHNRQTRQVRGMLCSNCNLWLGNRYDRDPSQFPSTLEGPRAKRDLMRHIATMFYVEGAYRPAKSYLAA